MALTHENGLNSRLTGKGDEPFCALQAVQDAAAAPSGSITLITHPVLFEVVGDTVEELQLRSSL